MFESREEIGNCHTHIDEWDEISKKTCNSSHLWKCAPTINVRVI